MASAADHRQREIIHMGDRQLRELGDSSPGMSFPRKVMRNLALLQDGDIVESAVKLRIYDDGTFEGVLVQAEPMDQPIWPPIDGSQ